MRQTLIATGLLLTLLTSAQAATIYKWVDTNGVTHFSAEPPAGQNAITVNPSAPRPGSVTPSQSTRDAEQTQEQVEREVKREVAAEQAEREKFCQTARRNLAQLELNPRVRIEDGDQVRRLSEEERQAKIESTRQSIAEHCN